MTVLYVHINLLAKLVQNRVCTSILCGCCKFTGAWSLQFIKNICSAEFAENFSAFAAIVFFKFKVLGADFLLRKNNAYC